MDFDPASDARSERVKARAAIAEKDVKQSDFESQFQAAFDSSSNSFAVLQADHLDGSVPGSTVASTPTSEGRVQMDGENSRLDEMLRLLSSISDRMSRNEDRLAQNEHVIKAIISGQAGTVPIVSGRIDTDDSGQGFGGPGASSTGFIAAGETADGVSSRSEHTERSLLTGADNPPPAYVDRVSGVEALYNAGEWKWRDPQETWRALQKLYQYDATNTGVAIGSNIVSLMQHRAWLASDSISTSASRPPSVTTFTKFLATYENYRKEGGRAKTIVSAAMWPTSMQEQAWSGLRDTEFSRIPKVSLDDELLIVGFWRWSSVNKVVELKKVLSSTPQCKLLKSNLDECLKSVSSALII